MVFINGWITRWECPICRVGCTPRLIVEGTNNIYHVYDHPSNHPTFVNGYPAVCDNSGKTLSKDEINIVHEPNYFNYGGGTCA